MTDAQLAVTMNGVFAGMLTHLQDNRLRFEYDAAYRATPGATPISLSMPLAGGAFSDGPRERRVSNFLWGLLPDNAEVISLWAARFQVSPSSPFALLSTPVGEDCAGAIAFCAPTELSRLLERPGAVTWLSEDDVARKLRDLRENATVWLGKDFTGQFSLAGAQAKMALLNHDGRWGLPTGRIPTTHIFKTGAKGFEGHDLNEHLCLAAAQHAGIWSASSIAQSFGDQTALVVTRYDRQWLATNEYGRIHQEDMCQAFGIGPAYKYQNEGGPTPAQIADLLWSTMPAREAGFAVRRFADALIWNWVIGGTDAHAKNYSLLLSGSQVELAPMYDVASVLPYDHDEHKAKMAMKIGGEYTFRPERNTWPAAARELRLPEGEVINRVQHLAANAPQAFLDAAAHSTVASLHNGRVRSLIDGVARRARRCAEVAAY